MCKKHMHRMFKDAIFDALLPWDVMRELVSYTDYMARIRNMAANYEMDMQISRHRLEREQEERRKTRELGVVYYARLAGDRVKIGRTKKLRDRMAALRVRAEDVLAVEPGGVGVESDRHRQFKDLRHGRLEDFDATPELMAHIEQVREEWGDPWEVAA